MYNILVCDDDHDIVAALEIYLRGAGYNPIPAYSGEEALHVLEEQPIHLVLMDVMMPGMDGIRTTLQLRKDYNVPVIMLTAKSEDNDKILGLNVGADDYETKPFNTMEVLARVNSQIRRYTTLGGKQAETDQNHLAVGPIAMDVERREVTVDGEPVALTRLEFSILQLLMSHPGQVFSNSQIYETVWKDSLYGSDNIVAVHIRHLREKLEINPKEPRHLKVVWGLGYKIEG
ncbi:MAG: response regulator transcription factor [Oscillospiraceae bacterium]|nr:response regulator transcription factor [Oscillospiraceae bacterium]